MTTQIWLLTSGSYSDYSVHAAFTSRELAEQFIARETAAGRGRSGYDEYDIEERSLFDVVPEAQPLVTGSARLMPDGSLSEIVVHTSIDPFGEDVCPTASGDVHKTARGRWVHVHGYRDEKAVRKALQDAAAQIRAHDGGIA